VKHSVLVQWLLVSGK